MSFKLLALKIVKPVGLAVAVAGSAYGYREWEKAKTALKLTTNDVDMTALFENVDVDHSGFIDKQELNEALRKAGLKVNQLSLEAMMQAADENGDGKISKEEWLHICHRLTNEPDNQHSHHIPAASQPQKEASPVISHERYGVFDEKKSVGGSNHK